MDFDGAVWSELSEARLFAGTGLLLQLFFALKQRKVTKEIVHYVLFELDGIHESSISSQTRFAPRVLTARAHPHPTLLLDYKEKELPRGFDLNREVSRI